MMAERSHCERMVADAVSASKAWRQVSLDVRVSALTRAADLYLENADEFAAVMAKEMGKPVRQGHAEAASCASILRYYADNAEELLQADRLVDAPEQSARVEIKPTGVILGIMPWNYPHYQLVRLIAPNLLLGNTVLFKHAKICGESAQLVEQLFERAGVLQHAVKNSDFSHEEVFTAIADPGIAGVSFTGGEVAGAAIARAAGGAIKKVVLELGGNDPFIVCDADRTEELAVLAADTRLANAGQTCVSPKRIIVQESLMPRFLRVFTERFLRAEPGDPLNEDTVLGPLATEGAAEDLRELLRSAQASGVEILGDPEEVARIGRSFSPQIVVNPPRDHALWTQELFGPIAVIATARDAAEAIDLANDSVYGLGATVFTDNSEDIERFQSGLECGMVAVNGTKGGNPALPFGGVKRSGFGRELGSYGLREFANQKLIVLHR